MRPCHSQRRQKEAGVAAVEFGLILPVLLIVLLGIMDYGYVFFVHLNMTNAAREGARVGVTRQTTGGAETDAKTIATNYLGNVGITDATVSANLDGGTGALRVQIDLPFHALIGFVPVPSQLSANATMRWESFQ